MTMSHESVGLSSSQPSHSRFWLLTISFVCSLVLLLFFAGVGRANQAAISPTPQTVEVMQVSLESSYIQTTQGVGIIEAKENSDVGFELSGQVSVFTVDEGDKVAKGDVIALLDTRRLEAQQAELEASLTRADAQANLANLTAKRVASLVKQNLESSQRLDEVNAELRATQAQVSEIQAGIERIRVEIDKSQLLAPFDGQITRRFVDTGTVVNAGQPVLGLTANSALEARFALPSSLAKRTQVGEVLTLEQGEMRYQGIVRAKLPQRALQTRTVDVMVEVRDASQTLLPGDIVTATLEQEFDQRGVWVPVSALSNGLRGLWTLYVVGHEGDDSLSSRSVEVIYTNGDKAFVRGALSEQDYVVMSGTHRLVPNQQVVAVKSSTDVNAG